MSSPGRGRLRGKVTDDSRDTRPQRRLVTVSHHADIVGGGEISLLTLLEGIDRRRWSPLLVVPAKGELARRAREIDVPVESIRMPGLRLPRPAVIGAILRLAGLLRRVRADVVHANGSRAALYAGLAGRLTRRPVAWHVRILDDDPPLDWLLVRLATGIIATSSAVRDRLSPWPRAQRRCRIVPNGLDLEAFVPSTDPDTVRRRLGLSPADLVVITVGRMVPFKRQDLLLEAVARLHGEFTRLGCIIVGDGPERPGLLELAERLALGDRVRFTGHRDDVADLLAAADVFVLPSPAEHFGRVVLEAMAVGVPVVAVDAGGPAEILEDGKSGLLVPEATAASLASGMATLLRDRRLRQRIAETARTVVEKRYSMEAHARRVESFLAELVEEAG